MKKARQILIMKVGRANGKVGRAISKINGAYTPSRRSRISFAPANGKLYFERLETFQAAQNHLPHKGVKMLPKSAFSLVGIM